MMLVWPVLTALAAAILMTPLVKRLAFWFGAVDRPGAPRKIHRQVTPLLGGLAVFLAVASGSAVALWLGILPSENLSTKNLVGLLIAGGVLMVGGALDDRFDLRPRYQILFPLLASAIVVAFGVGIDFVTNPLGGQLRLDAWEWIVLWWRGVPYKLTLPSDLFTVAWLMVMMYATKFADGMDGLVSGITVIGSVVITGISFLVEPVQPDTALLALVVAAAYLGFLRYNFNPASIFLGEGGSVFAGFMLGALAIVSGGKVATTLLVLSLPLLDLIFTVVRRLAAGRSPFSADRLHLHFRLLDAGLSQRQVVLIIWLVSASAGIVTLVVTRGSPLTALMLLVSLAAAGWAARLTWLRVKPNKYEK